MFHPASSPKVRSSNDAGGLWGMIRENSLSRIYLGVHWSYDGFVRDDCAEIDLTQNVGGVRLGIDIANDIWTRGLHPAPDRTTPAAGRRRRGRGPGPRSGHGANVRHPALGRRPRTTDPASRRRTSKRTW